MLGKLIKHEFVATWKIFTLIDVVCLIAGVIVGIFMYNFPYLENLPEALSILLGMGFVGYIILLISVCVLSLVYVVVRYYKSLYTSEGYLTFTLPATVTEILSAKMLVGFIWQVINYLCVFLSGCLAFGGFILWGIRSSDIILQDVVESFGDVMNEIFGIGWSPMLLVYILFLLVGIITNLLTFYFSISLGQLWQQHKVLGSIIFYFVVRFVIGLLGTFISIGSGSFNILFTATTADYFTHIMWSGLVLNIILSVVMYFGCIFITNKKLNLD